MYAALVVVFALFIREKIGQMSFMLRMMYFVAFGAVIGGVYNLIEANVINRQFIRELIARRGP